MTRFSENPETVEDRHTGLMWTRNASVAEFPMTWRESFDFIGEMNLSFLYGYHDWRLPNRKELFSLVSHGFVNPALPEGHPFQKVFEGYYWTSTTCTRLPVQAWTVHLGGARVFTGMKHRSCMLWPVRDADNSGRLHQTGQQDCYDEKGNVIDCFHSGQDAAIRSGLARPTPLLVENKDVVYDNQTGLTWTKNANISRQPVQWPEAFSIVDSLNQKKVFGFSDWRLPSIIELDSLTDMGKHSPALPDPAVFENIMDFYWSSTASRYDDRYAWVLYLQDGAVGVGFKPLKEFFVWAVRGNQISFLR